MNCITKNYSQNYWNIDELRNNENYNSYNTNQYNNFNNNSYTKSNQYYLINNHQ